MIPSILLRLVFWLSLCGSNRARTVQFSIDITQTLIDPVGNGPKIGILANGTFPGPRLQAKAGDDIEFFVRNRLKQDTSIHFHGISQASSPWSDGTPGVSQVAIKPGAAYLYRWRAEEPGVFFYHGHWHGHIMDGLYGAIVIEPNEESYAPFHLISTHRGEQEAMRRAEKTIHPLLVADYTQLPFEEFDRAQNDANTEIFCMDAIVVNGQVGLSISVKCSTSS
jgi:FtsP/CotA-like multicopper oxidase with cupredoxin domain